MFALRFSDLNLLISNQITSQSRIMFDRGVQARVSKAAPFLQPRRRSLPGPARRADRLGPGRLHDHRQLPLRAERRHHARCPPAAGSTSTFNYVRNSVKVVINAYTGKMTFYVMDPNDPIIQTYEKAFPGMFTPASR